MKHINIMTKNLK